MLPRVVFCQTAYLIDIAKVETDHTNRCVTLLPGLSTYLNQVGHTTIQCDLFQAVLSHSLHTSFCQLHCITYKLFCTWPPLAVALSNSTDILCGNSRPSSFYVSQLLLCDAKFYYTASTPPIFMKLTISCVFSECHQWTLTCSWHQLCGPSQEQSSSKFTPTCTTDQWS